MGLTILFNHSPKAVHPRFRGARTDGLTAAGAAILILAWAKARTILNVYLGLGQAAALRRGFGLALALYAGLLLALYVMG